MPDRALKRWWWYRPGQWSGLLPSRMSDEYGRHTLVLPTLLFGTFVIALKPCTCDDFAEFRCVNDGCPYLAMTPGSECLACDPSEEDDDGEMDSGTDPEHYPDFKEHGGYGY